MREIPRGLSSQPMLGDQHPLTTYQMTFELVQEGGAWLIDDYEAGSPRAGSTDYDIADPTLSPAERGEAIVRIVQRISRLNRRLGRRPAMGRAKLDDRGSWSPVPRPVEPDGSAAQAARLLAATIGSAVVGVTTFVALGLGMLSPMATGSCETESDPACVNEGKYATLLVVGPVVLGAATLVAVWFRAMRRPRLIWFVVWALLLAATFLTANSLAGGELL